MDDKLLTLAFEALVSSHLLTRQQRQMGQRLELGPITCIHYNYTWEGRHQEADYFFVYNTSPETVSTILEDYGPADNHQLFVVADKPGLVVSYMAMGLSFLSPPHYLMAHSLDELPGYQSTHVVHQATKASDALLLSSIDGADPVMAVDMMDPTFQYYYVIDSQRPMAMARNALLEPKVSWVSHVYTAQNRRGQGMATALMNAIMADRNREGDLWSLLLATEEAHSMYQRLGYLNLAPVINFIISSN